MVKFWDASSLSKRKKFNWLLVTDLYPICKENNDKFMFKIDKFIRIGLFSAPL